MSSARDILDHAMTEAELQDWIVELAQRTGWKVAHFRPAQDRKGNWKTAMQGDPGYPDLTMVHQERGIIVFAELKSAKPGAEMSDDQWGWHGALAIAARLINWSHYSVPLDVEESGVYVMVWRPSDQDEIEQLLVGETA